MRIFYVCGDRGIPLDGTKGASVHLRSLACALARCGHRVALFLPRLPGEGIGEGISIRALDSLRSFREAARTLGSPDLVYERYSLGHELGLQAAWDLGVPFALEVNAPLVLEAARHRPGTLRPTHRETEERLFRDADAVFAVSEPLRRYVAKVRGTDDRTWVLGNGCDPGLFPSPASLDARRGDVVVFLGHPKPWHGADLLVPLLSTLIRRRRDARLLLIGGGPGAETIVEAARAEGVQNRVEVTGSLSPHLAARRLLDAAVAVAPYPLDPFFYFSPLKIVEYMAAGLPVVASVVGDIPAILGGTGILVPPGEIGPLADAVEGLVKDQGLSRHLGALARQRALSRFSWDHVAAELLARMNHLVRGAAA